MASSVALRAWVRVVEMAEKQSWVEERKVEGGGVVVVTVVEVREAAGWGG